MHTRTAAAILAIALTGAACASNNGTGGGTGGYGGAPPTSAATSPSSGYGSSTSGGKYSYGSSSPSTSGANGGASLTVAQGNYSFTPSAPAAKEGSTIRITNSTSTTPHTFTITGTPIDLTVDPGTSQTVKLDLPPGTYPFFCRFHVSSGMKGALTIKAK